MEQYLNISQMALDILSIPATSYNCERIFNKLSDILAPQQSRIKPDVIAALQYNHSFNRNSFIRK
jgi:hypothetical protein